MTVSQRRGALARRLPDIAQRMDYQRSTRRQVSLEGIGLHSGKLVHLTLSPAQQDSGIVFRVGDGEPIPAAPESVVDSHYATTLGRGGTRIQTVEHLSDELVCKTQSPVAGGRLGSIPMLDPIRIQQMKQEEVRLAPLDHQAGGFGPDLVMLRPAERLEGGVSFVGKNAVNH